MAGHLSVFFLSLQVAYAEHTLLTRAYAEQEPMGPNGIMLTRAYAARILHFQWEPNTSEGRGGLQLTNVWQSRKTWKVIVLIETCLKFQGSDSMLRLQGGKPKCAYAEFLKTAIMCCKTQWKHEFVALLEL